jgi:nucleotide-binding universal stress UspA family protein
MTTDHFTDPRPGPSMGTPDPHWSDTGRAVIVGIDGSDRSRAALEWAVGDAESSGRPLIMLAAIWPTASMRQPRTDDEVAAVRNGLDQVAARVRELHPNLTVTTEVSLGTAVQALVTTGSRNNQIVVGRRGLGSFHRLLVGSTSMDVSGRASVPVVMVPDEWNQAEHASQPVVLGVHLETDHRSTLFYAFGVAARRNAELHVVHALDAEGTLVWDPVDSRELIDHWRSRASSVLDSSLAQLRTAFPTVQVRVFHQAFHPAGLLLEHGLEAQLVVVGRHSQGPLGGLALGSVARAVVHHATCPVAVVPDGTPHA